MKRVRIAAKDLTLVHRSPPSLKPPGSLVRLNSGGPVGIVLSLDENDRVRIKWPFDDDPILLPDACVTLA